MEPTLSPHIAAICKAAAPFGPRLERPLEALTAALPLASKLGASPSADHSDTEVDSLQAQLALVDDLQEVVPPSDLLYNHITVLCECTAVLECVLTDDPPAAVAATQAELTDPLVALRAMNDSSNTELADAVTPFLAALAAHVAGGSGAGASAASDAHTAAHLKDFREMVTGATLANIKHASVALGEPLSPLADMFAAAMQELYNFIVSASKLSAKPDDDTRQQMLMPVAKHIGAVSEAVASVSPRDSLFNHAKAIEDAMGMLSWVVADSKPITFVSDAEGASSFNLDRILLAARRTRETEKHKPFVTAMKAVFPDMKAYIKEHFTMGLEYGRGVDGPADGENLPATSPVSATADGDEEEDSPNYVSAFRDLLDGPLKAYTDASAAIGGDVEKQAHVFADAWKAEADFLSKAINTPKPDDIQSLLAPIATKMGEVSAISEAADPRGPFSHHCSAVSESIAALGWVAVDEKATAFVGDSAGAGQFYIDKVKMGARKTDNPDAQRAWASSLQALYIELKAYVKEHHTQTLVWNPPKAVKKASRARRVVDDDDEEDTSDYVSTFKVLLSGPLASFAEASKEIGGEVAEQCTAFVAAWEAEAAFLGKAINMPKPDDVQGMLGDIASKMGEVGAVSEKVDPRGPLSQHCQAVSESIAALGWVAVDEKATAFVGDMAGTGQFFIDKVKMGARKTDKPEAHKKWASSLEALYAGLKAYVKEHHTQKLTWNPPKAAKKSRSRSIVEDDDSDYPTDYVTAFQALITGPLAAYSDASKTIGGEVSEQCDSFVDAWKAEADFLAKAISMPKPDDVQSMLGDISSKMGQVSAISEKADPRGPLAQHCQAVGESMAALGWVAVDEKATAFVGDMAGAGQFFVDKVKMGARKTDNPEAHRAWASSLETLYADLKAYVKEYHTQKLTWNPPKAAKKVRARKTVTDDDDSSSSDYVTAFQELLSGPLAKFSEASKAIGGEVAEQGESFAGAWKAEAEFLSKAIVTPKPDDVQSMLGPIAAKMGEVAAVTEKVDPRGPFTHHCNAVSESIAALGWVAVDEKATAFVGDMAATGQFFIDKVKMGARKTDKPDAHRQWASSLEELYAGLKAYVKEHHTQMLTWNPPKAAKRAMRPSSRPVESVRSSDYVSAFRELVDGPLASYLQACNALGGDVQKQAEPFGAAWEAEAEFLKKAIKMKKPGDVQPMLTPIATKMQEVSGISESTDPRGPLANHCTAVAESVSALGWVAVDEKATAFVGDMAGAGQFFVDKVKMGARKSDNPDAHRAWASSLETLYANLKAYVKEYHTQKLSWSS